MHSPTTPQRQSVLPLIWVTMLLTCCCLVARSDESLKQQARKLVNELNSTFKTASRITELVEAYQEARDKQLFTDETIDPVAEVKQLTDQISQMVERKARALKEAAVKAEEVAANYRYNPNIEMTDVQYLCGSKIKDENEFLEYDRRFLQKVVKNQSVVHIPVSIYKGRKDILNQLKWTEKVEKTLVDLVANQEYFQDSVPYIYLTTDMGLFRLVPGMKWREFEDIASMYDARRTSWFIEGSTCPKDMLLLIDTSGSMHGQNLLLTKQAAKSLIRTLGENDYVAVGQYPGKAKNAENTDDPHLLHDKEPSSVGSNSTTCFHTFVQATKQHKNRLFKQIDSIAAKGIVNLVDAMNFSFSLFLNHSKHRNKTDDNHGAQCVSILALFTDGDISSDMEKAMQLIRDFKTKNKLLEKVRIFVFSVGVHRNPDEPLKELACSNRGAFTDVPAMGAVTSDVQEGYLTTLRSLVALNEAQLPIGSRSGPTMLLHSHFDTNKYRTFMFFSVNQIKDLGFGVLSSLTLPIYNSSGNNSFIGLVGTDIAVKDWVALVPKHKLGPNGYAFTLNSNGYVVFHPELKTSPAEEKQNQRDNWYKEPAYLDLLEVEMDDKVKRRVRRHILQSIGKPVGTNNSAPFVTIHTFIRVQDDEHVYKGDLSYAYRGINGTPYVAALVLPSVGHRYAVFGPQSLASVLQTDNGSWTVTVTSNETGESRSKSFPSKWARYLVPKGNLFCSEYFRAPLVASLLNGTDEVAVSNLTLDDGFGSDTYDMDEHAVKELTERLLLTPLNMSNLLHTMANSVNVSGLCSPHWTAAVALDLALLDAFFAKQPSLDSVEPAGMVRSVAASGLSGITGAFPTVAPYKTSWQNGLSAATYQRAMLLPELLFVTVETNRSSKEYNLSTVTATEPAITTMASMTVFTDNATSANWTAAPNIESVVPEPPDVTLFKAVTLEDGFKVGVSGVTLSGRWFSDLVFLTEEFGTLCDPKKTNNTCYVVEDAGYIVAANQDLGSIRFFLGTVDKPLMRYLVFNLTVYSSVQEFDHQGICDQDTSKNTDKHASNLRQQSIGLLMLPTAASLILTQNMGLHGRLGQLMMMPLIPMLALANPDRPEECIKMGYRYYRTNLSAEEPLTGTDELDRKVTVAYLKGTNLILVAVSSHPGKGHPDLGRVHETGAADFDQLRREPERDLGPDVCMQDFRYRVRPDTCYEYHPKEDRVCLSGSAAPVIHHLLVLTSVSAVVFVTTVWRSFA